MLEEQPFLGAPIARREEYRQIVLRVLNAAYVFQYRIGRGILEALGINFAQPDQPQRPASQLRVWRPQTRVDEF